MSAAHEVSSEPEALREGSEKDAHAPPTYDGDNEKNDVKISDGEFYVPDDNDEFMDPRLKVSHCGSTDFLIFADSLLGLSHSSCCKNCRFAQRPHVCCSDPLNRSQVKQHPASPS